MKLQSYLLLAILGVAVVIGGCKKGPEKMIVKTWKVTNVMTKGTIDETQFQTLKTNLMKAEMAFKDGKYSMTSDGKVIETEQGMNMDAVVSKESLTLDTPDFMITLQPK